MRPGGSSWRWSFWWWPVVAFISCRALAGGRCDAPALTVRQAGPGIWHSTCGDSPDLSTRAGGRHWVQGVR